MHCCILIVNENVASEGKTNPFNATMKEFIYVEESWTLPERKMKN